jgi:hypothetical protein
MPFLCAARCWPVPSLGAICGGLLRLSMDGDGIASLQYKAEGTAVDARGRRLDIYGSEGWGFESLRACRPKPLRVSAGFTYALVVDVILSGRPLGAIRRSDHGIREITLAPGSLLEMPLGVVSGSACHRSGLGVQRSRGLGWDLGRRSRSPCSASLSK